jgi:hydrogenase maturation protease
LSKDKLVIGLGNVLLKDEGVGVRCVEYLKKMGKGEGLELVDGGTSGFTILDIMKEFRKTVIVDAVDMGKEPGHVASFDAERVLSLSHGAKFSLHEINLVDIIQVGKKIGYNFKDVKIVGIQPQDVSRGDALSETVEKKMSVLAERVLKEINNQ